MQTSFWNRKVTRWPQRIALTPGTKPVADRLEASSADSSVLTYAGWRLGLGIGEEKLHGDHGHKQSLYRASVAYDFHVGGFGIAPTFNLDRVDGESIEVYGVTFSKAF